jgi:hypothetical protein
MILASNVGSVRNLGAVIQFFMDIYKIFCSCVDHKILDKTADVYCILFSKQ